MAVMIRLARQGSKKKPEYLIVATSEAGKRDGGFLAKLGHYFPRATTAAAKVKVDAEALQKWLASGAQMTRTVKQALQAAQKKAAQ
jgi:small subunit ribosomal protein S16